MKYGLMIRKDNQAIRAFSSKFDKELGDKMNVDGFDYKVCRLAMWELNTFPLKTLLTSYNYNSPTGHSKDLVK